MEKWNLVKKTLPDALILTAHPDDETIFAGGLMLSYPNWKWNIVCITMQFGTTRPKEFESAIQILRQKGVKIASHNVLGKPDPGQIELTNKEYSEWKSSIKSLNLEPDITFTHNAAGEYDHPHHKAANKIAHELYENVWDFIFPGINYPQIRKNQINKINLTKEILRTKNDIFNTAYQDQVLWQDLPDVMEYEFKKGPELFTF